MPRGQGKITIKLSMCILNISFGDDDVSFYSTITYDTKIKYIIDKRLKPRQLFECFLHLFTGLTDQLSLSVNPVNSEQVQEALKQLSGF